MTYESFEIREQLKAAPKQSSQEIIRAFFDAQDVSGLQIVMKTFDLGEDFYKKLWDNLFVLGGTGVTWCQDFWLSVTRQTVSEFPSEFFTDQVVKHGSYRPTFRDMQADIILAKQLFNGHYKDSWHGEWVTFKHSSNIVDAVRATLLYYTEEE